jgi:glutamate N-acetyltransferase/amino-acid N-acetyltransferase
VATCRAGNPQIIGEGTAEFGKLCETVSEVAQILAQAIVRDGEGATKFITIVVDEGAYPRRSPARREIDRQFAAR